MKRIFECIDAHTCGNPVRLVVSGGPDLKGNTMMERRLHFLEEFDWIRKALMFEPRGHDMMSGSILYPPTDPTNDIGILFIETSGCLPMCGHGTIGSVTIMIQEGLVVPKEPGKLRLETPGGLVKVDYGEEDGKVKWVRLENIPSFLHSTGLEVECPGIGKLNLDVSFGGNFYAIVDVQKNFPGLEHFTASQLIDFSRFIRSDLQDRVEFNHPTLPDVKGLSHVLWAGTPIHQDSTARNAVFYGDKAIDRSPCGTGTSARMAQWYANGKLNVGDQFIHESIIGSRFIGRVENTLEIGGYKAIIPSIEGWARVTGYNRIVVDSEDDPYAFGFQVI